jgi:hypothetical protein
MDERQRRLNEDRAAVARQALSGYGILSVRELDTRSLPDAIEDFLVDVLHLANVRRNHLDLGALVEAVEKRHAEEAA